MGQDADDTRRQPGLAQARGEHEEPPDADGSADRARLHRELNVVVVGLAIPDPPLEAPRRAMASMRPMRSCAGIASAGQAAAPTGRRRGSTREIASGKVLRPAPVSQVPDIDSSDWRHTAVRPLSSAAIWPKPSSSASSTTATGTARRIGFTRFKPGVPDYWDVIGPDGELVRREYDDDGDGRVDRSEP